MCTASAGAGGAGATGLGETRVIGESEGHRPQHTESEGPQGAGRWGASPPLPHTRKELECAPFPTGDPQAKI